ncbi:MAG: VIT domain-containing protein [Spirochaetota bacterium]|nr:VIT domain-containing protein [Spirochaetota bacterium]
MRLILSVFLLIVFAVTVYPQTLPPEIIIDRQLRPEIKKPLKLTRVNIDVKIFGYIAETKMTMTFYNPNDRVLSGDLYFPLPEGSLVKGYALDIKGVMVDGVIVEKQKARQVFEKIVRQGIDPGLVEWVKGNNFKTRVFPIPSKGTRTIMVKYLSDITEKEKEHTFTLPLNFKKPVDELRVRVEVIRAMGKPTLKEGNPEVFRFRRWRTSYIANAYIRNASLTKDMVLALPDVEKQKVLVELGDDGQYYFAINDIEHEPKGDIREEPSSITLFWDASGSRGESSHKKEFEVLRKYFRSLEKKTIELRLRVFRNEIGERKTFQINNGNVKELISYLSRLPYDGGTQMASISPDKGIKPPDFYLLFSDGLSNFGKEKPAGFKKAVYSFSADSRTNHSFLKYLALSTGGRYFNLSRLSVPAVVENIGMANWSFLASTAYKKSVDECYPSMQEAVNGRFTLIGKLKERMGVVTVSYGLTGRSFKKRTFRIPIRKAMRGNMIRTYWAQKKLSELMIFPKKNEKEIVELGKRYGFVTPGTSLIVLESLDQYLEHKIRPPRTLAAMRSKYDRTMAQKQYQKRAEEQKAIQSVLAMWQSRVSWWNKDFKYPKDFKYAVRGKKGKLSSRIGGSPSGNTPEPEAFSEGEDEGEGEGGAGLPSASLRVMRPLDDKRSMNKTGAKKDGVSVDKPEGSIKLEARDPNTPYLNELKQSRKGEEYIVYMKNRKKFGRSPAFYLDCANYFLKKKEKDLAIQILSNIAELELENAALIRVLAHRLSQLGYLDISIMLFEEALKLRPEEPQSHRDLALVLARRAEENSNRTLTERQMDYQKAIKLLYHVVIHKWDRFREIELIALMELNRLIPKARKARVQNIPVDRRLIKALAVDIRIVLTWDADLTDMDLWVTEPSGEKAMYSHNRTTIGGLVSRDFTQGYGPEEYLVKRAMRGVYKIEANFYGSSAPKLIGAVTLQLDIYVNYGRPNEKRQTVTLRLENKREVIKVGEIKF